MTADDIKDALRRRHSSTIAPMKWDKGYNDPGPWTTVEEFEDIDLLAFAAWRNPKPQVPGDWRNPIVGYEVKVSRNDMRSELLNPSKRKLAVDACHQFFFAIPYDLMKKDELDFKEPIEWQRDYSAFVREVCDTCGGHKFKKGSHSLWKRYGGRHSMQRIQTPVTYGERYCRLPYNYPEFIPEDDDGFEPKGFQSTVAFFWRKCPDCNGRGYTEKSEVEQKAPTLWLPRDVGLVTVNSNGIAKTVVQAPPKEPTRQFATGPLVRHVSYRPDKNHLVEIKKREGWKD